MKIEKRQIIYVILLVTFVLIALGAFIRIVPTGIPLVNSSADLSTASINRSLPPHTALVSVRNKTYLVDLAATEAEREKGLGGRESLPENSGMLFIFDVPEQYGFWMKDTLIPLDMIWIDESKHIVYIEKKVQPNSFPTLFAPEDDALYVLELNANEAEKNLFAIGDEVSISSALLR